MELDITELRLGLPGGCGFASLINEKKMGFSDMCDDEASGTNIGNRKVAMKIQVVGWLPVCSYRKKNSFNDEDRAEMSRMYKGYPDLAMALEKLFGHFGISEALKDADADNPVIRIFYMTGSEI